VWCIWLGIAIATAGVPPDDTPSNATETEHASPEAPIWSGGSRDQIFDIVGVEEQVKAIGSTLDDVELISADLDWGEYVSPATGSQTEGDRGGFSHSSLTVTRERVLDASLVDSVRSMAHPDTYDLSDPNEGARLCARLPTEREEALRVHTWTQDAAQSDGNNDHARRGESPSILMADGDNTRTAMIALKPGESVTLIEISDRENRRVQRRLEVQRRKRTLTVTEGSAKSKVCLDF